jgi:hypothetical protein
MCLRLALPLGLEASTSGLSLQVGKILAVLRSFLFGSFVASDAGKDCWLQSWVALLLRYAVPWLSFADYRALLGSC